MQALNQFDCAIIFKEPLTLASHIFGCWLSNFVLLFCMSSFGETFPFSLKLGSLALLHFKSLLFTKKKGKESNNKK